MLFPMMSRETRKSFHLWLMLGLVMVAVTLQIQTMSWYIILFFHVIFIKINYQVLLVSGGWSGNRQIDSTEILVGGGSWTEIESARLPLEAGKIGLRIVSIDNNLFSSGGEHRGGNRTNPTFTQVRTILKFDKDNLQWSKTGSLKIGRYHHAVSVVDSGVTGRHLCEPL